MTTAAKQLEDIEAAAAKAAAKAEAMENGIADEGRAETQSAAQAERAAGAAAESRNPGTSDDTPSTGNKHGQGSSDGTGDRRTGSDKQDPKSGAGKETSGSGSGGSSGRGCSFAPATDVLLSDGKTVPISSLKPGDKVLAANTKTGKTSPEKVSAVEINHDHDLYNLKVKSDGHDAVIRTTSNHLFWVPSLNKWVPAAQLKKGEHLRTADGTITLADGGSTPKVHVGWMWDLTVPGNGDHDFYVTAVVSVLVHNCGEGGPGASESDARQARDEAWSLQASRTDYPRAAQQGTTAVIGVFNHETQTWSKKVAMETSGPMPEAWAGKVAPGEFVPNAGGISHAEDSILDSLGENEEPMYGGTSRNICIGQCYRQLNTRGMIFGGEGDMGGLSDKTPYSYFFQGGGSE